MTARPFPDQPAAPVSIELYRAGRTNRCPDCGASQWFVGRITAECACCGTALPLSSPASRLIITGE